MRRASFRIGFVALTLLGSGCVAFAPSVSSDADVERVERRTGSDDTVPSVTFSAEQIDDAIKTPVTLLGEVVDDAGQPVADANISAVLFDQRIDPVVYPYIGFRQLSPRMSNRKGRFALRRLRGAALQIRVSHPDYVGVNKMYRTYVFNDVLAGLQNQPPPRPGAREQFVMTPAPSAGALAEISTGAAKISPGVPLFLSLRQPGAYGVDPADADLRIDCSGTAITTQTPTRWWCEVSAVGTGGLQEIKLLDPEFAPKAPRSYQNTVRFEYDPKQPDWRSRDTRELFVRTRDNLYAKIDLRLRPVGEFYVAIEGLLNRDGERRVDR